MTNRGNMHAGSPVITSWSSRPSFFTGGFNPSNLAEEEECNSAAHMNAQFISDGLRTRPRQKGYQLLCHLSYTFHTNNTLNIHLFFKMGTRPQSSWRSLLSFFSVALFSLLLLLYLGPSRNSGQDLRVPVTERDLHDDAVTNLTKRATATYQAASEKGAKLHCLLAMSKEDVEAADGGKYKEPAKWLQKWGIEDSQGWVTEAEEGEEGADKNAPYWGDYLDAAFSSLDISKSDAHNVHWIHLSDAEIFPDPEEFEGTAEQGVVSC